MHGPKANTDFEGAEKPGSDKNGTKRMASVNFVYPNVFNDIRNIRRKTIHPPENNIPLPYAPSLIACAEAIQQENLKLAEALMKRVVFEVASQVLPKRKVASYFAEALGRIIYRLSPLAPPESLKLQHPIEIYFYETYPYLKFAHFTANQAISEAFRGKQRVHVIDFSLKWGAQWPALLQALALRPGGPLIFRLTGIGVPSGDTDYLREVGQRLANFAEAINIEFEFRGYIAESLADIEPEMLGLRDGEVVAVNSIFQLHGLLSRRGAVEKVLAAVKEMKPRILTVVEQEANHNGPVFLDRFTESLDYYSALFASLESSFPLVDDVTDMSNHIEIVAHFGKQICNVLACEGVDRVERHETVTQWKTRFESAGFEAIRFESQAFMQARMLLALFSGVDGYRVEEKEGCLTLCWHTRPLITTSAWMLR